MEFRLINDDLKEGHLFFFSMKISTLFTFFFIVIKINTIIIIIGRRDSICF